MNDDDAGNVVAGVDGLVEKKVVHRVPPQKDARHPFVFPQERVVNQFVDGFVELRLHIVGQHHVNPIYFGIGFK
jgi:hypothetical protein